MDHIGLLLSISELNQLLHESTSLATFLDQCVKIVARHFDAQVCSIYLYDPAQKCLNLCSTHGLNTDRIHSVSLKLGEGLTGLALEEMRPIMAKEGSKHPNYRYFPGLKEELFDAFLAVPILRGIERIGVLVVQRNISRPFDDDDQKSLRGVSNQLASMIEYARLLIGTGKKNAPPAGDAPECPRFIKGRSASAGWVIGRAVVDTQVRNPASVLEGLSVTGQTIRDFDTAVEKTIDQLTKYQERIEERLSDVASLIFAAHILLLKDDQFVGGMRRLINDGTAPGWAVANIAQEYCAMFGGLKNSYMKQKADDIRDVSLRLLGNLLPRLSHSLSTKGAVVIARDLLPSDILVLSVENAAGVVLTEGGAASHVSILARSLKLPLVIADCPALFSLPGGSVVLVDADSGNIFIDPGPDVRAPYEQRGKRRASLAARSGELPAETFTADGQKITLLANINLLSDVADALEVGAGGIGLYRTEFPFIIRSNFPTEEEQLIVYRKLVDAMPGRPITFRTLDIGGDKILSYYTAMSERNPFLGMRSIRFCLEHREVFSQQIRAILRAGETADLRIMFPMISSVDELEDALAVFESCKKELAAEGMRHKKSPRVGMMVELPSVLETIDGFAGRVDFFSIGTNDLVQYLLGVDRTNEKVAKFYRPHHPAVLRAVRRVADAAARGGIDFSICGDMAHDPRYAEFFIGIGVTTLSIDPLYFPAVSNAIRSLHFERARKKARTLLTCDSIREVEALL